MTTAQEVEEHANRIAMLGMDQSVVLLRQYARLIKTHAEAVAENARLKAALDRYSEDEMLCNDTIEQPADLRQALNRASYGGEWVIRITQDCISVNDNVSVDDAAQAVVAEIGRYLNKSKWVGLTDEEVIEYFGERWTGYSGYFSCFVEVMKWAEAKVKEKNGG